MVRYSAGTFPSFSDSILRFILLIQHEISGVICCMLFKPYKLKINFLSLRLLHHNMFTLFPVLVFVFPLNKLEYIY